MLNNYPKIECQAKYRLIYGEGRPVMLASRPSHLARIARVVRSLTICDQMLQRLPIALVQVKVGNASEKLLNEIRQIIYSLYRAKEITKRVQNNIMNSIKL